MNNNNYQEDSDDMVMSDVLMDYSPPEPSRDMVDKIMESVALEPVADLSERQVNDTWKFQLALLASIVVAGISFIALWSTRPETVGGSITSTKQTVVVLGNRASATVEAGTHLAYEIVPSFLWRSQSAQLVQKSGQSLYRVNHGGLFTVETPSGRVRVTGTEFKVEVNDMKEKGVKQVTSAGVVAMTIVTVYVGSVILENDQGSVALAAGQSGHARSGQVPMLSSEHQIETPKGAAHNDSKKNVIRRMKNEKQRKELIEKINTARALREHIERAREHAQQASNNDDEISKTMFKETVQDAVNAIIEDVKQCYDDQLKDSPDFGGKLIVSFAVNAEKDVGGVIERVKINDKSDGAMRENQEFSECMIDAIYTLELMEPEVGGIVDINYPFLLSSGRP